MFSSCLRPLAFLLKAFIQSAVKVRWDGGKRNRYN
jgi:hypothetical protein